MENLSSVAASQTYFRSNHRLRSRSVAVSHGGGTAGTEIKVPSDGSPGLSEVSFFFEPGLGQDIIALHASPADRTSSAHPGCLLVVFA